VLGGVASAAVPGGCGTTDELLAAVIESTRRGVEAGIEHARLEVREVRVDSNLRRECGTGLELAAVGAGARDVTVARAAGLRGSRVVDDVAEALDEIRRANGDAI